MEKHILRNHLNIEQTNVELMFDCSETSVTVRSFFRCQQIKCVACYCENSHHSRIEPFQVFLRGSCGAWSVQMFYVCVKSQARSQVNEASCNIVFPVKTVCYTGCKHHSVTPKLLLRSASAFSRVLPLSADDTRTEPFSARFRSPRGTAAEQ